MAAPLALTDGAISPRVLPSTSVVTTSGVGNFLRDLDKLQEQQIHFAKKVEKQKRLKQEYEEELEVSRLQMLNIALMNFILVTGFKSGSTCIKSGYTIGRLKERGRAKLQENDPSH